MELLTLSTLIHYLLILNIQCIFMATDSYSLFDFLHEQYCPSEKCDMVQGMHLLTISWSVDIAGMADEKLIAKLLCLQKLGWLTTLVQIMITVQRVTWLCACAVLLVDQKLYVVYCQMFGHLMYLPMLMQTRHLCM